MIPMFIMAINDSGERDFMISLYEDYRFVMFAISYNILHDKELAEDVVGSVLEKLVSKVSVVMEVDRAALRSYIVSATKNTALNSAAKRARERRKFVYLDSETEEEIPASDDIEYTIQRHDTARQIADALSSLQFKDREILRMKYYNAMTDREIADVMKAQPSTVRSSLTRARKRLLVACRERGLEI